MGRRGVGKPVVDEGDETDVPGAALPDGGGGVVGEAPCEHGVGDVAAARMADDKRANHMAAQAIALTPVGDNTGVEECFNVMQQAISEADIGLLENCAVQNQFV